METMENYVQKLIDVYKNLAELQEEKYGILAQRQIEKLNLVDEKILSFYNQALEISKKRELVKPNEEEIRKINALYEKMSTLEQVNQAIIEQSLSVIGKVFNGIMKMANNQPDEYTKAGKTTPNEGYILSTIQEEA